MAEYIYERNALGDLLGVPARKVSDDRPYCAPDVSLPHKSAFDRHLKDHLFALSL